MLALFERGATLSELDMEHLLNGSPPLVGGLFHRAGDAAMSTAIGEALPAGPKSRPHWLHETSANGGSLGEGGEGLADSPAGMPKGSVSRNIG
jgi:hypothetical protein